MEGDLEEFSDFRLPVNPIPVTYNAAPQSMQPIIRLSPATGDPEMVMARWGLIPSWAKDDKIGFSTINARAEELETKPAFRDALKSKHCLVPANSFYEWQRLTSKDKLPYAIGLRSKKPFAFAGLWDCWKARNGSVVTVITVTPNDLVTPLHDRMPVHPRERHDFGQVFRRLSG